MAEPVSALRKIDRTLAIGSWLTAAVLIVMLFAGPAVIANDEETRDAASAGSAVYGKGAGADGAKVFQASCGSCHTLSAAGTSGQVGPNLDGTSLSAADIESIVRGGRGTMPAFGGQLTDAEIAAVAAFVEASN
jgi:mono/diheme cytochrome c family protein